MINSEKKTLKNLVIIRKKNIFYKQKARTTNIKNNKLQNKIKTLKNRLENSKKSQKFKKKKKIAFDIDRRKTSKCFKFKKFIKRSLEYIKSHTFIDSINSFYNS